jgi:hypothetical protein
MTTEDLIKAAAARCDRIVAGFDDLRPILTPVLPIIGDDPSRLPLIERIASIALLKRYEQLQDMLGRLFRAYLTWDASSGLIQAYVTLRARLAEQGLIP